MKIASFNIKHRLFYDKCQISKKVKKVIDDNKIDVLCTQEIPRRLAKSFESHLEGYSVIGDSRYQHYLKSFPFNEKNPIITKNKVIESKTIRYRNKIKTIKEFFRYLKKIPIFPRIATIVAIKVNDKKDICIINTHLDYKLSIIQKKELNELLELIKIYKNKYEIILTGDFNMDTSSKHFNAFINSASLLGINKLDIKGYTWRGKNGKKRVLDYIFVSDSLNIKDFGIIKSNSLSDHEIIYVDLYI